MSSFNSLKNNLSTMSKITLNSADPNQLICLRNDISKIKEKVEKLQHTLSKGQLGYLIMMVGVSFALN
jgi:hypothetical protein